MIPYLTQQEIDDIRSWCPERHWRGVAERWSANKWKAASICRINRMDNLNLRVRATEETGVIQDGPIGIVGLNLLRHRRAA